MEFFFFQSKMFTFGFICSKLQLKSQAGFVIFQQLKFHNHFSPYLKITVLSNQCQCKTAFAACNVCQNTSFKQSQLSKVFPFIFMCDYTYILILKGIVSSDQLIGLRHHFSGSILHNHTIYSTGCYDKCFKNGATKSFSKTQFMVHRTEWIRKHMVYFFLDVKFKVDSFQLIHYRLLR